MWSRSPKETGELQLSVAVVLKPKASPGGGFEALAEDTGRRSERAKTVLGQVVGDAVDDGSVLGIED